MLTNLKSLPQINLKKQQQFIIKQKRYPKQQMKNSYMTTS